MKKIIIGIDPGEKGGIAVLEADTNIVHAFNMPESFVDIYNFLDNLKNNAFEGCQMRAILEDVGHGMPGQSSRATATFARHNGHLEMALYALRIQTIKVTPAKWQKHFSNTLGSSKGVEKNAWKRKLKTLAMTRHPETKVTLDTADAILLADYGLESK